MSKLSSRICSASDKRLNVASVADDPSQTSGNVIDAPELRSKLLSTKQ